MNLYRKIDEFPTRLRGGALTIGNFDGVHHGHVRIIQQLKESALRCGGPAVVFTFDPHPAKVLRPEAAPQPLTWVDRKADLLAELGVDAMIACPTDRELLSKTYQEFFQQLIVDRIGARAMIEGPNFKFGKGRLGTIDQLRQLCTAQKIDLQIVQPLLLDGDMVSSSRIRDLIRIGEVSRANSMLNHPYRVRGMVTHGAARGAEMGYPTANLEAIDTLLPAFGVYAGRAHVQHRPQWAAIHLGPSPTFGEQLPKVEIHILDFDQSLYGEVVEVDFVQRLRDIQKFDSADQLKQAVEADVHRIRLIAQDQIHLTQPTPDIQS